VGVLVVVFVICYVKIIVISKIPNYLLKKITQNVKKFFPLVFFAFNLAMKKSDLVPMVLGLAVIAGVLFFWWIKWLTIKPIA
jgi:hypothetical protein